MENVSVEAAMKKAIRILTVTALIILTPMLPFMIFLVIEGYSGGTVLLGTLICFAFCFIVGCIYNNKAMQRWRIWAFTNVRNVHELRDAAVQYMFVPKSKLHFSVEFPSASFKQEWKALQYRFDTPDEMLEDITLPDATTIPSNKVLLFVNSGLVALIFPTILAIVSFKDTPTLFILIMAVNIFLVLIFKKRIRRFFSKDIQLMIDEKGIEIDSDKFYTWDSITDISFRRVYLNEITGNPSRTKHWRSLYDKNDSTDIALCLQHSTGEKIIPLSSYKTNRYKLNSIIQTYQIRHGKLNQ